MLGLETTFLVCRVVGWVGGWLGGWIIWKYNQLSPQLGWVGAWAELGNTNRKKYKKTRLGCFDVTAILS